MAQINWTDEAVRWLQDIFEYIAADDPQAAARTVEGIYDRAQVLSNFPEIGHRYPASRRNVQSAAYYALSVIEGQFGSRADAVAALNVPMAALRRIGELSSTRGDPHTARKARAAHVALTRRELHWLHVAVRRLLLQLGYLAAGVPAPEVSAADLSLA